MSEKNQEEQDLQKTASEKSSQKDGSNKEDDGSNSQDASKGKSKEVGGFEINAPGDSVIGNQVPQGVLNQSKQDEPKVQEESDLILDLVKKHGTGNAEGQKGDGNPADDEEEDGEEGDKNQQDKKSEKSAHIPKAPLSNQESGKDTQDITEELAKKYP